MLLRSKTCPHHSQIMPTPEMSPRATITQAIHPLSTLLTPAPALAPAFTAPPATGRVAPPPVTLGEAVESPVSNGPVPVVYPGAVILAVTAISELKLEKIRLASALAVAWMENVVLVVTREDVGVREDILVVMKKL